MEYWVMRVMLHQGHPVQLDMMTPGAALVATAAIATGTLAMLGDGAICDPVEVFDNEADARQYRGKLQAEHPLEDFRIILNADVPV